MTYNNGTNVVSPSGSLSTGNGIVNQSITDGSSYTVYAFGLSNTSGSSANNYVINYTLSTSQNVYILAVGGGGSGGFNRGGGGGGGGVYSGSYACNSGSGAITISVGSGGAGVTSMNGNNGVNTTITFTGSTTGTITAGGGSGGQYQSVTANGGSSGSPQSLSGGAGTSTGFGGGGAGAGQVGYNHNAPTGYRGIGGAGLNVTNVTAIKNFVLSGQPVSYWYWGGGGSGQCGDSTGGIGGGGSADVTYSPVTTANGGIGINNGQSNNTTTPFAGAGGTNTGGGGGGAAYGSPTYPTSGAGGSGIVIIAFPTKNLVSFTPTSITGLKLWLDATDPNNDGTKLLDGASLVTWKDKSTNGYNVTKGTGNNATYSITGFNGQPTFNFNGSGYLSSVYPANTFSNPSYLTVFVVFSSHPSVLTDTAYRGLVNPAGSGVYDHYSGAGFGCNPYGVSITSGQVQYFQAFTTPTIYCFTINNNIWSAYYNGGKNTDCTANAIGSFSGNFSGSDRFYIAYRSLASDAFFYGKISEVIIYNSVLSTTNRQLVENYLAQKYGIQSVLPNYPTHPYGPLETPVPTPDLLWFKCDSTTYNNSGSTFINSALSGSDYNGSIWNAASGTNQGTVLQGSYGAKTAISCSSTANAFLITTPRFSYPVSSTLGFTLVFWCYVNASGGNATRIMSIGTTTNASGQTDASQDAPSIYLGSSGTAIATFNEQGGNPPVSVYSPSPTLAGGTWYHIALVGTCGTSPPAAGPYGKYMNSGTNTGTQVLYINNSVVTLGASLQGYAGLGDSNYPNSWSMGFTNKNGAVAYYKDIRLYKKPLTATQISWLYNNTG